MDPMEVFGLYASLVCLQFHKSCCVVLRRYSPLKAYGGTQNIYSSLVHWRTPYRSTCSVRMASALRVNSHVVEYSNRQVGMRFLKHHPWATKIFCMEIDTFGVDLKIRRCQFLLRIFTTKFATFTVAVMKSTTKSAFNTW